MDSSHASLLMLVLPEFLFVSKPVAFSGPSLGSQWCALGCWFPACLPIQSAPATALLQAKQPLSAAAPPPWNATLPWKVGAGLKMCIFGLSFITLPSRLCWLMGFKKENTGYEDTLPSKRQVFRSVHLLQALLFLLAKARRISAGSPGWSKSRPRPGSVESRFGCPGQAKTGQLVHTRGHIEAPLLRGFSKQSIVGRSPDN